MDARNIRRLGASLAARLADVAQDAIALVGAGMITYGVELVYRPAGFIVGGMFLLGGAWINARKSA